MNRKEWPAFSSPSNPPTRNQQAPMASEQALPLPSCGHWLWMGLGAGVTGSHCRGRMSCSRHMASLCAISPNKCIFHIIIARFLAFIMLMIFFRHSRFPESNALIERMGWKNRRCCVPLSFIYLRKSYFLFLFHDWKHSTFTRKLGYLFHWHAYTVNLVWKTVLLKNEWIKS